MPLACAPSRSPLAWTPSRAAADLGESEVKEILQHRGTAKKRVEMEFEVLWSDGDTSWESWDSVKKLEPLDAYIRAHPEAKLSSLLPKS